MTFKVAATALNKLVNEDIYYVKDNDNALQTKHALYVDSDGIEVQIIVTKNKEDQMGTEHPIVKSRKPIKGWMKIRLGPDEGNSGAIIRWGECLDNGVWLRGWRYRKLWIKKSAWRYLSGYLSLGVILFRWGN